jgi:hypothetical protein
LGHSENIAFVQFLMEDGVAISHLRKLNAEASNIGGVYEPRMPLIREIPLEVTSVNRPTRSSKIKSITDDPNRPAIPNPTSQPSKSPEVYELPLITQMPKMLTWMYFRTKVSRLSPKKLLDGCAQPSHQCSLACFKLKPMCLL